MNTILSQGNDLLIHLYVQFSCVLISRTLKKLLFVFWRKTFKFHLSKYRRIVMLFCSPVESNCLAGCVFVIADYPDRMEHAILNTWIEVKWFLHVCYFQRRKFNVNTRLSIQSSVLFINRMLIHVALRSWTLSLYTLKQWEAKFLIKDSTRPWQRYMYCMLMYTIMRNGFLR